MKKFNSKVVVITGAVSGLGQALAIKFAEQGALLANELRDPYLFEDAEGGKYLYYTGAGEHAIRVTRLLRVD